MKKGLGKGLDALFENNYLETSDQKETQKQLRISSIEPNKEQPRKSFDTESLETLARSMKEHGVLQPLLVKPIGEDKYQIIAGERRWRAARLAGLSEVPVVIMDSDEQKSAEIALIENLQREDLNILEEALGYRQLMDQFSLTQEQVSGKVGKSRSAVANTLRLLALPAPVQQLLRDGELSAGHARALLALESQEDMEKTALLIVKEDLSVRQVEKLVRRMLTAPQAAPSPELEMRKLYLNDLEKKLTEDFGRKIQIKDKGKKGSIVLEYYDSEDLENLLAQLKK